MEEKARSLQVEKTLNAPVLQVWEAWTNPEHITKWWGPNGFTSTIHKMDLQTGGEWKLTLHGPDGTNFPNRSVFEEIVPFQKIVFEHFNPSFITTVTFEPCGEQTIVNWSMLFETVEMHDVVVKAHQADVGLRQNIERLANYFMP